MFFSRKTMLEYIGCELDNDQCQLNNEEIPTLGEISDLARIAKKVHRNMARNNISVGVNLLSLFFCLILLLCYAKYIN